MRKIAFTICAKNYIGLAQVLESSIKKFNNDIDFYIFVADEFETKNEVLPINVLISRDVLPISYENWNQMSFKYDLTEFCTSIKPICFNYILNNFNPDSCIYFDPDILVFNSLRSVYEKLTTSSIVLTPHITTIENKYTGKLKEQNLLFSGMFNLGFLALKNDINSRKMLNWWEIRLEDRCFKDTMESYFTDQKWMDFLPSLFPENIHISSHLGLNLAPWNFHERDVFVDNGKYYVKNRINTESNNVYELIFVHFSGFNYKLLLNDEVSHGTLDKLNDYKDIDLIVGEYSKILKSSNLTKYINFNYTYNLFSNGVRISNTYRRLFRRLFEDGKIGTNPFDSNGEFYLKLSRKKMLKIGVVYNDKITLNNLTNTNKKIQVINRFFYIAFRLLGAERFFQLCRALRIYSKIENQIFIIDSEYNNKFKLRI